MEKTGIDLVKWRGPLGPKREPEEIPYFEGMTVWDAIPQEYRDAEVVDVRLNGRALSDISVYSDRPKPGDVISLRPVAGVASLVGAVVALVVGIALKVGEYHLTKAQKKRARQTRKHTGLGTFTFDIFGNSVEDGAALPVVMGEHRTGGVLIQQFTRGITQNDREKDVLYSLLAVSDGPIAAITDCHLDGNDITNYSGATMTAALGVQTPTAIQDFREVAAATALNIQLTTAAAVVCAGTTAADKFIIKLTFVSGLYYLDNDGHPHSSEFKVETRYRTTAGPGAWSAKTLHTFQRRRCDAFSIYPGGTFPSKGTYDLEVSRSTADHGTQDGKVYADAYVKEYQEIAYDDLIYPRLALAAVKAVSTDSLTGNRPEITVLAQGVLCPIMSSATVVTTPAWTRNPAELSLGMLYARRWGLLCEIDPGIELTMSSTALDYAAGETITGPAATLQFIGVVESWNSTTRKLVVEAYQGFPYGNLTGATSGKVAAVSSIDEAYGCDLPRLWTWRQFCEEWVPDGGTRTNVNQNSAQGGDVLYVASTAIATDGDHIRVNPDGARDETLIIASVGADHFHTTTNLVYPHTAAQNDAVCKAEVRAQFDYVWANGEDGWSALARIGRTARCIPVQYGGFITFVTLKSETPSGLISEGNIIFDDSGKSSLKLSFPEISARPNQLALKFYDRDHDYLQQTALIEDPFAQSLGEKPFRSEDEIFGITRRNQAMRVGLATLKRLRYASDPIEFKMGLDAVDFEVGDVRWLVHSYPEYGTRGGRAVSSTASTITLDQPVTVAGGESIRIRHTSDGTEEAHVLAATAGTFRVLTITDTWTTNPVSGELYAIGDCQAIRVTSIKPSQDLQYQVQVEPDDVSYYLDDWGSLPSWTENQIPNAMKIPPDVTGITTAGRAVVNRDIGSINRNIDVGWTKPVSQAYSYAEIWLKSTAAQILTAGRADRKPGADNGEFNYPMGIACDGTYVYIADFINGVIRKHLQIDLSWVANLGSPGTGDGQFTRPTGVWTNGTHIWVADCANHRIQKLTVGGVFVAKIGSAGAGANQFWYPWAITGDGAGYVYVLDTHNHRLVKIDDALSGSPAGTWTTIGTQGVGNDQFNGPQGIACDGTNLYIGDTRNNRVVKRLCSDLSYVAKIGTVGTGTNQFTGPIGVAVNSTPDTIWVADQGNNRLVQLSTALVWADATGTRGFGRLQYDGIHGLAWNDSKVWLTENLNHRAQCRDDEAGASASSFEFIARSNVEQYTISNVRLADAYRVAVRAVSVWGAGKDPVDAPYDDIAITEMRVQPPDVTGFAAQSYGGGSATVRLKWKNVEHPDLRGYEIRRGESWQIGSPVYEGTEPNAIDNAPPSGEAKYWIAALANGTPKLYSPNPAGVVIRTSPPSTYRPGAPNWNYRS
ncbi:MAG: phage tail protein [bacterium]